MSGFKSKLTKLKSQTRVLCSNPKSVFISFFHDLFINSNSVLLTLCIASKCNIKYVKRRKLSFVKLTLFLFIVAETLPDALASGCTKCNDKQKATAEKVIRHLIHNRNNDWIRLTQKYDPSGEYRRRYEHLYNAKN